MADAERYRRVADLLLAIEAEMRRIELWEADAPAAEALASTAPFCYDTLAFHQWVQWVLLARLRERVTAGAPLPSGSSIHPLAEHSCAELECDTDRLLPLIAELDRLLNEKT